MKDARCDYCGKKLKIGNCIYEACCSEYGVWQTLKFDSEYCRDTWIREVGTMKPFLKCEKHG